MKSLNPGLKRTAAIFAVMLVICLAWILASQVRLFPTTHGPVFLGADGMLSALEEQTITARLAMRGPLASPLPLHYVDVDSDALRLLGNFPWNRELFALALDGLFDYGKARAVGIDLVLSKSGIPQLGRAEAEAGSLALGRSIRRHGNVVLAATFGVPDSILGTSGRFPFVFDPRAADPNQLPELPDYPVVGPTWGTIGLITTIGDSVNLVPFFAKTAGQTYLPLSLQLALMHWGLDASAVQIGSREMTVTKPDGTVLARIPLLLGQIVEPNWFSPWDSPENPRSSIARVIAMNELAKNGTDEEKAEAAKFFERFRDAIVLIGPTDPLLKDISRIPLSGAQPVPRVSIHGNLVKTIVSGRFLHRPPVVVNVVIIAVIGLIAAASCFVPIRFSAYAWPAVLGLLVLYVAAAFVTFGHSGLILPLVAPVGAALSCLFVAVLLQLSDEQRQRRRIKELFGSYVSAAVVEQMVENNIPPQTGGAEVEITAFFSDIVAFSPLAEELRPKDLVELMCEYLGESTAAVIGEGGTLDKYVGDAIVAIYGAPLPCAGHASAACRAALSLQETQVRLRVQWGGNGDRWPLRVRQMRSRVGLHTGLAVVGNIGSKLRFNYTMMGDTVNLAQRIEAAAGHFGAGILVSGETHAAASKDDPDLVFRALDRILVPGRTQPVEIYELLGRGPEAAAACADRIASYAAARRLYREGQWAEAAEAFRFAARNEPARDTTNPPLVMAARCDHLIGRPAMADYICPLSKG